MVKTRFIEELLFNAMVFKMFCATYLLFFFPSPVFAINIIVTILTFFLFVIHKISKPNRIPLYVIIISIIYDLIITDFISIQFNYLMQLLFMPMATVFMYQSVNFIWFKDKLISFVLVLQLILTPIIYLFIYRNINFSIFVYAALSVIGILIILQQHKMIEEEKKNGSGI